MQNPILKYSFANSLYINFYNNLLKHQNTDVINKEKELIENAKLEAKQILLDAKETADSIIKNIRKFQLKI